MDNFGIMGNSGTVLQRGQIEAQGHGTGAQPTGPHDIPKQSPVESALDRLSKMAETARCELNELRSRLSPVAQPVPMDSGEKANQARPSSTCAIEERISDITATVLAINVELRIARNSLCI